MSFSMEGQIPTAQEELASSQSSTLEKESQNGSQNGSQVSLPAPVKEMDPAEKKKMDQAKAKAEQQAFYGVDKIVVPTYSKPKGHFNKFRFVIGDVYRRIFALCFVINIIGIAFVAMQPLDIAVTNAVSGVAANLLAAGLSRWPIGSNSFYYVINATPHWFPLWWRRRVAKVYHFGGVHSGTGASALAWYILFTTLLTMKTFPLSSSDPLFGYKVALLVLVYILLLELLAIIVAAIPILRIKQHDSFEYTHRFMGWLAVVLLWPQVFIYGVIAAHDKEDILANELWKLPSFWLALVLTAITIHPWLLLSKVPVNAERLSDHAVRLHFAHREIGFAQGIEISHHPLRDWHSFAAFPDPNGYSFSLIVSKAGDFTQGLIDNPPTRLYKKGYPKFGVVKGMQVFKSFVIVATGSGIGPCLSFIGTQLPPHKLIWQSRGPYKTYGEGMLDVVKLLDDDPIIIDTDKTGRQDIIPYILKAKADIEAEAVVIISNPVFTADTVYRLESIGIPAYGPIFDS